MERIKQIYNEYLNNEDFAGFVNRNAELSNEELIDKYKLSIVKLAIEIKENNEFLRDKLS